MLTAAQVASLLSISQRAVYDIPLNELPLTTWAVAVVRYATSPLTWKPTNKHADPLGLPQQAMAL